MTKICLDGKFFVNSGDLEQTEYCKTVAGRTKDYISNFKSVLNGLKPCIIPVSVTFSI